MKRLLIAVVAAFGLSVLVVSGASAEVDNFKITDYKIDYQLSRDDENRSVLKTTETITAQFPNKDQNRGIERVVPRTYNDHPTSLEVESVVGADDQEWKHRVFNRGDNSIIRIGDTSKYVHGKQVYKITYTQRDVTRAYTNTKSDEFYWNTNGTDWRVPIENLSVRLQISTDLTEKLTGRTACYFGAQGSSQSCQLAEDEEQSIYTATEQDLKPGENITLAIGFEPNTFAEYRQPTLEKILNIWLPMQIILFAASAAVVIWITVRYHRLSYRTSEQKPITPEYLPPKDTSVVVSASLFNNHKSFTALMLDLAVRRYINIRETKQKTTFSPAEFEIEIIKPIDDLKSEEREVLEDMFTDGVAVGKRFELKKIQSSTKIYRNMKDNDVKIAKLVRDDYKLRARNETHSAWHKRVSKIMLVLGLVLLSPPILGAALVVFIMADTLHPLSDKGLRLIRYLKGVQMYVRLAEADRIKTLQSPEGAERVGDISDESRIVKLYERLLPYATIFGVEKEWNKQIGRYYENMNRQPDWYVGTTGGAYSATAFTNAMNSFNTTTGGSSATGGSTGGGYSGGGGGGGGGGGW